MFDSCGFCTADSWWEAYDPTWSRFPANNILRDRVREELGLFPPTVFTAVMITTVPSLGLYFELIVEPIQASGDNGLPENDSLPRQGRAPTYLTGDSDRLHAVQTPCDACYNTVQLPSKEVALLLLPSFALSLPVVVVETDRAE